MSKKSCPSDLPERLGRGSYTSEMQDLGITFFFFELTFTDYGHEHRFAMMQNKETSFQLRLFQYKHNITKKKSG